MVYQPSFAKVDDSTEEGIGCGEGGDGNVRCTCLLQNPPQQTKGVKTLAKEDLRTTLPERLQNLLNLIRSHLPAPPLSRLRSPLPAAPQLAASRCQPAESWRWYQL